MELLIALLFLFGIYSFREWLLGPKKIPPDDEDHLGI
jgi:hypothetical protein